MRISQFLVLALFIGARCSAVPLSFEKRDPGHFLARFANRTVELRPDRVILPDVTLRFVGATSAARLEGLGAAAPSTYLRAGLVRTFPQFAKLAIYDLYPGVHAVFYGNGESLEYDLNLASGASPGCIQISLEGARNIRIDHAGNLTMETASGVLQQMRPRVFQASREIAARYVLLTANEVGIRLGKRDRRLPLTIDPVLAYVKTLGGSGSSRATAIAVDAQGNIYVTGQSSSADFPATSNGFEPNPTAPLQVVSNAGQTIRPLRAAAGSITALSGTPDGAILYAATSNGIFLSVDSGATFKQTATLPVPATVNTIDVDLFDPSRILIATNRGLFGQASNTGLPVSGNGSASVTSAFYDPRNPLIAYATTSTPAFLVASADAGGSWRQLNPTYPGEPPAPTIPYPPVAATISLDGSILYAVNGNGTLLKSADGGSSWVKLAQGLYGSLGFGPAAIKLDPSNSNRLYVLGPVGLQKSADGGLTFSKVSLPITPRQFAVDSSGALYVGGIDLIGGGANQVYVSIDGGNTFTLLPRLSRPDITAMTALGSNVYVASTGPAVPFVVKLDPSGTNILYSTFLGGSVGDGIAGLAIDSSGSAVLVGAAGSPDFPLTAPVPNPPSPAKPVGFVAKLSPDGTRLIYSIGLGGSKAASVQTVALDSSGTVYIAGQSRSGDFPTTTGAFQPALPATPCTRPQVNAPGILANSGTYAFASKLSADGNSVLYSTFLTGSCGSTARGIAIDAAGDAMVVGFTTSPDFPVSPQSYQSTFPGDPTQPSPPGVFGAGFVAKLSPAGAKLVASSYLGGGYSSEASAVALDASGNAYITGYTQGFVPPATPGAFQSTFVDRCAPPFFIGPSQPNTGTSDAFVLKLDPALSAARFLTYLGGACGDAGNGIALDATGNVWVGGSTLSPDFPLRGPFQGGGISGGFVTELSPDASQVLFSSFSEGSALALTSSAVYLAGTRDTLALVEKIDTATTPAVIVDSVVPVVGFPPASNATVSAGLASGVAPGLLVQINGRNLGPASQVNAQLDASGRLPFIAANTIVFFDNIPAPLISVQASSIVCFAPFELSSRTQITVLSNGQRSNAVLVGVAPSAPQILSIANQDGAANSADHPAQAGSVIALYVSGLGETSPLSVDGLVNSAPLAAPLVRVTVFLASTGSQINPDAVSAAPGLIAGITQVNVRVPASTGTTPNGVGIRVNSATATLYVTQ